MTAHRHTSAARFRAAVAGLVAFVALASTPPMPLADREHVQPLFDLASPSGGPFPSDFFTVADDQQNTGLRVDLPRPAGCETLRPKPSDCDDLQTMNLLDGFSREPRISIPFSGAIDPSSVRSETVLLVALGDAVSGSRAGGTVAIDQVVWDVLSNTLHFAPDVTLDEHARYAIVLTRGVRDARGERIERSEEFERLRDGDDSDRDRAPDRARAARLSAYRKTLRDALAEARRAGVREGDIAAVSVFTTMSTTAPLQRLRDAVRTSPAPEPADFVLGTASDGSARRSVFAVDEINGNALKFNRQTGDNPVAFSVADLKTRFALLGRGLVGRLAFGRVKSPSYLDPASAVIPTFGTRTGNLPTPELRDLYFVVFLPAGNRPPPNGWPVVIFCHGSGDNKVGGPFNIAASMAAKGLATLAFDLVGAGFGPASSVSVGLTNGTSVTVRAGGRGVDADHNGTIGAGEGGQAAPPRSIEVGRNAAHQGAIDVIQLVRAIDVGMDVDGDQVRDLDASRVYVAGFSGGGGVAMNAMALEPRIQAGVFTAPGAGFSFLAHSIVARGDVGQALADHEPSLINSPPITQIDGVPVAQPWFNDNSPLPHHDPVINTVEGAMAIQRFLDLLHWATQPGSTRAAAQLLQKHPLPDAPVRPFLLQFAKGDQNVLNPTMGKVLRAGDIAGHATFVRYDLAFQRPPAANMLTNPHTLILRTDSGDAAMRALAGKLQAQVAAFLASNGADVIDPDGSGPVFEVPISSDSVPTLDRLNYIVP